MRKLGGMGLALLLAALALVVAARSGDGTARAAARGDVQTLNVWAMGTEGEKLGQLAQQFTKANPDIKVRVTPIAWDVAHDKLLTSIAGDQTPDVAQLGTTWMAEFADAGALDQVPDDIGSSKFFKSAWGTNVVDGTAYGVPWYVETRLLYYRTDIAKKAGITHAPRTWADLLAMARAMKQKGGAKYGINIASNHWEEFMPFVWSNGGAIWDGDGHFTLNTPQVVEALKYWQTFFKEGLSPKSSPAGFDVTPAFVRGTHPMFFSGPWHLGLIRDTGGAKIKGKWAIAPVPTKRSATSFVGGASMVVFQNSDKRDQAWQFVKWLTQAETQQKWYAQVSDLPSVQSAWSEGALKTDKQMATFGQQLKQTRAAPAIPTWEEIGASMNEVLEKVANSKLTPQQGAEELQKAAEKIGTK